MYTDSRDETTDITESLTSKVVEVASQEYVYSYEDKVVATDRVFAFKEKYKPDTNLFQLIPNEGEKNIDYQKFLNSLDMEDFEVYEKLINAGENIMKGVKDLDISEISFKDLEEKIEIGGRKFSVIYASPSVEIAGISMKENLEKKLRGRVVV